MIVRISRMDSYDPSAIEIDVKSPSLATEVFMSCYQRCTNEREQGQVVTS